MKPYPMHVHTRSELCEGVCARGRMLPAEGGGVEAHALGVAFSGGVRTYCVACARLHYMRALSEWDPDALMVKIASESAASG